MYFADSILFRGMSVISFTFCATLLIVFMRRFKGYLGISASAARYQSSVSDSVESFFSTLSSLPGSFPKSCLEQLFCRRPVSACFCRKDSLLNLTWGIFQNFKTTAQGWRLWFVGLKSTKMKLHNKFVPGNFPKFQKTFKKFGQQFVLVTFL